MLLRLFSILLALGMFSAAGCMNYGDGVVTPAPGAFLSFEGELDGVSVYVDGELMPTIKDGRNERLQVKPGNRSVRIERGGEVIVNRKVFLGNQQVQIIRIP